MRFALVFSLLIALVAIVFAFQNPEPVNVQFLSFRTVPVPLAMVIVVTLLSGVLIGALFSLPSRFRSRSRIKKLEKQLADSGSTPSVSSAAAPSAASKPSAASTSSASTQAPADTSGGAAETGRLAAETRRMAEEAQRRAEQAERKADGS